LDPDGEVTRLDSKDGFQHPLLVKLHLDKVPMSLFSGLWHVRNIPSIRDGEVGEGVGVEVLFEIPRRNLLSGTQRSRLGGLFCEMKVERKGSSLTSGGHGGGRDTSERWKRWRAQGECDLRGGVEKRREDTREEMVASFFGDDARHFLWELAHGNGLRREAASGQGTFPFWACLSGTEEAVCLVVDFGSRPFAFLG
jgi:hypothetical protein